MRAPADRSPEGDNRRFHGAQNAARPHMPRRLRNAYLPISSRHTYAGLGRGTHAPADSKRKRPFTLERTPTTVQPPATQLEEARARQAHLRGRCTTSTPNSSTLLRHATFTMMP